MNVSPRRNQEQREARSPRSVEESQLHHENNDDNPAPPTPATGNDSLPTTAPAPAATPATTLESSSSQSHTQFRNSPSPSHNSHVPYLSSPDFMGLISHSSFSESYQTMTSPLFDHGMFSDPANVANDVFVPGSAYEALHTALRNRQLWTARSDIPSRGCSPDDRHIPGVGPTEADMRTGRDFALSSEREIVLWQNYLNEICLWVGIPFSTNTW